MQEILKTKATILYKAFNQSLLSYTVWVNIFVTILYPSKLKEFADISFRFDENGRKCSKRVENTVGKRRNCLIVTSNFSYSQSDFKRLVLQTCKNKGLFGKRVKDACKPFSQYMVQFDIYRNVL